MHGNGASNIATQGSKKTLSSEGMKFVTSEFIIATPFCNGKWKDPPGLWVSELLLRLRDMSCTDKERIYVTGYSKGGMGTWEISTMPRCAEVVAAIAPVCAYHIPSNRKRIVEALRRVPILAVHSTGDESCSWKKEKPLWDELRETLEESVEEDVDHTAMFERTYCDNTALYKWLLRHRKPHGTDPILGQARSWDVPSLGTGPLLGQALSH